MTAPRLDLHEYHVFDSTANEAARLYGQALAVADRAQQLCTAGKSDCVDLFAEAFLLDSDAVYLRPEREFRPKSAVLTAETSQAVCQRRALQHFDLACHLAPPAAASVFLQSAKFLLLFGSPFYQAAEVQLAAVRRYVSMCLLKGYALGSHLSFLTTISSGGERGGGPGTRGGTRTPAGGGGGDYSGKEERGGAGGAALKLPEKRAHESGRNRARIVRGVEVRTFDVGGSTARHVARAGALVPSAVEVTESSEREGGRETESELTCRRWRQIGLTDALYFSALLRVNLSRRRMEVLAEASQLLRAFVKRSEGAGSKQRASAFYLLSVCSVVVHAEGQLDVVPCSTTACSNPKCLRLFSEAREAVAPCRNCGKLGFCSRQCELEYTQAWHKHECVSAFARNRRVHCAFVSSSERAQKKKKRRQGGRKEKKPPKGAGKEGTEVLSLTSGCLMEESPSGKEGEEEEDGDDGDGLTSPERDRERETREDEEAETEMRKAVESAHSLLTVELHTGDGEEAAEVFK
uniref:MYND-type domain-containing protein n=1 Tax=Chromera velia CCMP2878 TaxID=1169474 RepID=A0A0G4F1P2_9ALVE|eukprot:Cvel_14545.t1-p1 / transcript=Cvel_14545.t1 / gene=Cvel_14545 / organism=Chromera_velia_CCMP2878 / gene_product=hypothetical protein / transcript_product=hypothetical protein / location=Cvel_scaffold1039:26022-32333(-) / protein_length=519 / sequence_SO=supercontig / SO=protein_coding / is_pseudo=false